MGTYQYKFIVDKIWKYSRNHPTIRDNSGNKNNIIDNSKNLEDLVFKTKSSEEQEEAAQVNSKKRRSKNKHKNQIQNQNFQVKKKKFTRKDSSLNSNKSSRNEENSNIEFSSETIPFKEEMNVDANYAPKCYTRAYDIDDFHVVDYISGKPDFVKDSSHFYGNSNCSYAKCLNLPPHINV